MRPYIQKAIITTASGETVTTEIKTYHKLYRYELYRSWANNEEKNTVVQKVTSVKFMLNGYRGLKRMFTLNEVRKMFMFNDKITLRVDGNVIASVKRERIK